MVQEIKGTSIIIVGFGQEGQSAYIYLRTYYPKLKLAIADKKPLVSKVEKNVKVYTGPDYLKYLSNFDTVIRSPGIPFNLEGLQAYKKSGGHITSATNIFFSRCPGTTIGITGTKGKSTTSSLIYNILCKQYADVRLVGNIGEPMLDHLKNANKHTLFVVELSSHQLEDIRYSPHIAVLLDIFPEHLDHYETLQTYIDAKKNITTFQKANDFLIFNPTHPETLKISQTSAAQKYPFTLTWQTSSSAWMDGNDLFIKEAKNKRHLLISKNKIPLLGKGNIENCLAAVVVGNLLQVYPQRMKQALQAFTPLPHRLEKIGTFKKITFYNDSLSTIPQATIQALDALGKNVTTLIVGGFDRGVDYQVLGTYLSQLPYLKTLILFPETGIKIWNAIDHKKVNLQKFEVVDMKKAVEIAYRETPPGKICLLSPASASFNLFKNYQERGQVFKKYVKKLAKKN